MLVFVALAFFFDRSKTTPAGKTYCWRFFLPKQLRNFEEE